MKIDKKSLAIVVMSLLLIAIFGYWVTGRIANKVNQRDTDNFNKGIEMGKLITIQSLIQATSQCQVATVRMDNNSINLISTGCIPIK